MGCWLIKPAPVNSERPWWEVLHVYRLASDEEVKAAYRSLRSKHHPDKSGNAEEFNRVQRAYEQWSAQQ